MSQSRRAILGGSAALAALGMPIAGTAPHPDAELIELCAEHIVNLHAYNASDSGLDCEFDPLFLAYEHTLHAIGEAVPLTMAGLFAKVRAAKAEALSLDGEEHPANGPAAKWAWQLVNDLLRLAKV
jgi:hypothetical protein